MTTFIPDDSEPHTGRFYGVARERLLSNPETSIRYLGFARTLLGNLRLGMALAEIPVAARVVTLPDGTVIRVVCACGVNQIFINNEDILKEQPPNECEFLVESGVVHYFVPGVNRIIEDIAPGTLYRGEKDQVPLSKNNLAPVTITGDDKSIIDLLPMGEHEGLSLSYNIPLLNVVDADPDKVIAEKEALFAKIDTVSRFPSSLYSGKLQLFLQAIYGTPVPLFRLGYQKVEFGIDFLVLDSVEIHFESSHTTGIITRAIKVGTPQGRIDYFIVSLETNENKTSVLIRKIVLSECGQRLLDFVLYLAQTEYKDRLNSNEWKELFTRFEAYWFSTARIKINIVASATLPGLIGTPFSLNGWTFSWNGEKAHLVTHEMVSLGGGNSKRVARLYSIAITASLASDGTDQFSLALTLDESAEYQIRPGKDLIWYYDYRLDEMVTVVTQGNPTPFGDAPIVCYYDVEDVLRIVRYSYQAETVATPEPGYEIAPDLYCYSINNQTAASEVVNLYWGTVITAGFYCEGVFDTRIRSGQHEYHRTHTLTIDPGPVPQAPVYDGTNYLGASNNAIPMQSFGLFGGFSAYPVQLGTWVLRTAKFTDTLHIETIDSVVSESLLILPKDDVRSVYYGSYQIKTTPNISTRVLGGERGWEQYFFLRPSPNIVGTTGTPFGGGGGYIYTGNGGAVSSEASTSTRYLVDVEVVDRQPKTVAIAFIDSDDYYGGVGSWVSVFDPPMLVDPTSDIIFWVVHSLTDDMTFATNGSTPDTQASVVGDYPYFSTYSYVGWA